VPVTVTKGTGTVFPDTATFTGFAPALVWTMLPLYVPVLFAFKRTKTVAITESPVGDNTNGVELLNHVVPPFEETS
jgi:hypothetical protein